MCLCHVQYSMLMWEYVFGTVNMHSNALTLVKRSDKTNGKPLLMSGHRCLYITFMWHFAYIYYNWRQEGENSPFTKSRHLVAVSCQDFSGHTEGVPFHTAICLIAVIQQGSSGTSELSDLPTSRGWLGSGKSSNSVRFGCVWCRKSEAYNSVLFLLVALHCLGCQKKALQWQQRSAVRASRPEGDLPCYPQTCEHTHTHTHTLKHAKSAARLSSGILVFEARQKHSEKVGMIIIAGVYFIHFALLWQFR